MESLEILYEQYDSYLIALGDNNTSDITTDLLQYGITKDYFDMVYNAIQLLQKFHGHYLKDKKYEKQYQQVLRVTVLVMLSSVCSSMF